MGKNTETLAGKVAVVTGAASGLGCGIAQGMVEAGAAVAFCDVDDAGAKETAAASAAPPRAFPVHMDVTDEGSVAAAFDQVLRHWGGVDIAVCAAGIAPAYELVEMPVNLWRKALEINLTGYFLVAREAARIMRAQGDGGAPAAVRDGLRHPRSLVFPSAMYDDGDTLLRQRLGGGLPDAAAAASYQRTLALKL